jgi:REP element-mobilizing transposase RayT
MFHCVFTTKGRIKLLTPEIRERLWPFIGAIARDNSMKLIVIGGIEDHVHMLITLPSTISIAKAMQIIKAGSSKFLRQTFRSTSNFEWQEGYAAFSVSISHQLETVRYILSQEQHHKTRSFAEEFIAFLQKHTIVYDEKKY